MTQNWTMATVLIADTDKAQAQLDLGDGFFNSPLSPTGTEPATNWMTSGPWSNEELQTICNTATWPKKVYFGTDWQAAIAAEGLQQVVVTPEQ